LAIEDFASKDSYFLSITVPDGKIWSIFLKLQFPILSLSISFGFFSNWNWIEQNQQTFKFIGGGEIFAYFPLWVSSDTLGGWKLFVGG